MLSSFVTHCKLDFVHYCTLVVNCSKKIWNCFDNQFRYGGVLVILMDEQSEFWCELTKEAEVQVTKSVIKESLNRSGSVHEYCNTQSGKFTSCKEGWYP